jgi:acetyl-CoA carboxylase carboxyl transferase subunit alpha
LKAHLLSDLAELDAFDEKELLNRRYQRLMNYGYC